MTTYRYTVSGTSAEGHEWEYAGLIEADLTVDVEAAAVSLVGDIFRSLSGGQPGVVCNNPYTVDRLLLERVGG